MVGQRNALHIDDPQVLAECVFQAPGGGAVNTAQKIIRKTYKVEYKMTNAQTSPCTVWEYRIMARNDLDNSSFDSVAEILAAPFGQPYSNSSAITPTTPVVPTTYGATPFMSNPFTTNFKVLKVKKRVIMPAKWWSIKYSVTKPREYSLQRFMKGDQFTTATDTVTTKIAKGQRLSLFVAHGSAASNDESAAGFEIGISNVNLLVEHTVKVSFANVHTVYAQSGGGVFQAGFAAQAQIPLPQVQNQPLYTIGLGAAAESAVVPMGAQSAGATTTGGVDIAMCEPNSGPYNTS